MFTWLAKAGDVVRNAARLRRWDPAHALGRRGEDLAHRHLEASGLRVVARNYRTPNGNGEADLIAWDGEILVFIEVKTRSSDEFGAPDRAIGDVKMEHIRRAALHYTRRAGVEWRNVRFDTVSILMNRPPLVDHVRDAFSVRSPN